MYFIFDIETNGLPKIFTKSIYELNNWPNIIQISWYLYNKYGKILKKKNYIIFPKDFIINKKSYNIHKIDNIKAKKYGYNIIYVLYKFKKDIINAKYIIGHNILFDCKVLLSEFIRNKLNFLFFKKKQLIDTKEISKKYCNIIYKNKIKWPTLKELYFKLFSKKIKKYHNSKYDALYTSKSFFYLLKNKLFNYKKYNIQRKFLKKKDKYYYIHLHNYTYYSILLSNTKIKNLIKKVYKNNMNAFGVIDRNNMISVYDVYNYLKKFNKKKHVNIKYIIGIELYIYNKNINKNYLHPFISKNKIGYLNLLKICSYAKFINKKNLISKKYIKKYNKGLIALTGNLKSKFNYLIYNQYNLIKIKKEFLWWKKIFKKNFYIEILFYYNKKNIKINNFLIKISKLLNIKYIIQNYNYFLNNKKSKIYKILHCIKHGLKIKNIQINKEKKNFFRSKQKMYNIFYKKYKQGFLNLKKMISKIKQYNIICKSDLPIVNNISYYFLKKYQQNNVFKYLKFLVYKNLYKKYIEINNIVLKRINYELNIIKYMNFSNYFLIIKQIIDKAKKEKVLIGPGRGSVSGSIIAYCLNITKIDPIKYNLLFERFLNKNRSILPDIDIDFDNIGRLKIIKWIYKKYNLNNVCNIIIYSHLGIKSSIKEISRIYNYSNKKINILNKLINNKIIYNNIINFIKKKKIKNNILNNNFFIKFKKKYKKKIKIILKKSLLINGIIKNIGKHACGIIITKKNINNYIPILNINNEKISQFNTKILQKINLLKIDFLSLITLSVIKKTLYDINNINLLKNILLNDKKIFKLFQKGNTIGVFQFESYGLRQYLIKLKPKKINDLIALNALYRPGPIKNINKYINRKYNKNKIVYDIPIMKKYLKETYGIIIYQEQIMILFNKIASFSKKDTDLLRQSIGKKNNILLKKIKKKFIKGGIKNNYKKYILYKIWNNCKTFAHYAFNKSHSTSYTYLSYQTAFLKKYYNLFYIKNLINFNYKNIKYINLIISDYKKYYKIFISPCVNYSNEKFFIKKKKIKFGFGIIKGINKKFIIKIIYERKKNGKFKSFFNFIKRLELNLINNSNIKILFYSAIIDFFFKKKINKFFIFKKKKINKLILLLKKINIFKNKKQLFLFKNKIKNKNEIKNKINNLLFNNKYIKYNEGFCFIKEKKKNGIALKNDIKNNYKYEIKYFKILELNFLNKFFFKKKKNTYGVLYKSIIKKNKIILFIENNFIKKKFFLYNNISKYKKYIKKYNILYIEFYIINNNYYIIYINLIKNLFKKFILKINLNKIKKKKIITYLNKNNNKKKKNKKYYLFFYNHNNNKLIKNIIYLNKKLFYKIKKYIFFYFIK